jgi:hypothetical protein
MATYLQKETDLPSFMIFTNSILNYLPFLCFNEEIAFLSLKYVRSDAEWYYEYKRCLQVETRLFCRQVLLQ